MNSQAQSLDVQRLLTEQVSEVFMTMLSLKVTPASEGALPDGIERVTGSVGFGGDTVTGAVYLHLTADLASRLTATMLGLSPEEIGEHEANDVVGEITNMLTGQLKSWLCDAGAACAVSTPAIIRGISYEIESLPEVRRELLRFRCDSDPLAVEVHIKFN